MTLGPGARLGAYEIEAKIGEGGMGAVYRARDTRLGRVVAVKVLPAHVASSPEARRRFEIEARSVAALNHPRVCTIHDVGRDGQIDFLVMEHLEGETLADRLTRGKLAVDEALAVAGDVAEALAAAHRRGIVHRDVKPGNVFLTPAGVKLLDFGLAKSLPPASDDPDSETRTAGPTVEGAVMGTPRYMSPEQLEGREVDHRTDLFSLGEVLYECVTGRRPFEASSRAGLIGEILHAEPAPMEATGVDVPAALERVVRKSLAKDPEARWQSARDLADELRWIAEAPQSTDLASDPPAPSSASPRLSWPLLGLAALGGLALGAFGLAVLFDDGEPVVASVPRYVSVTYQEGVVSAARFMPDELGVVYSASWANRPYDVFLGRPGDPDARALDLPEARVLSVSSGGEMALLLGPQDIVRGYGTRALATVPLTGGATRTLVERVIDADWIPQTEELAVVLDRDGRAELEMPLGSRVHSAPAIWSPRVSPDGRQVAFFEGPSHFGSAPLATITVVDREGQRRVLAEGFTGVGVAWSPSGDEVWFTATPGGEPPSLHAVSLAGTVRSLDRLPDWMVLHDVASDGRALVTRNSIGITAQCLAPGAPSERELGWVFASSFVGLSADGTFMIFADTLEVGTDDVPTTYRRDLDGSPAVRVGLGDPRSLSPDGRWVLASREGDWMLLPVGAGSEIRVEPGELTELGHGDWIDESQLVYQASDPEGATRVYRQGIDGADPVALSEAGAYLSRAAVTPDGTAVLALTDDGWLLYPVDGGAPTPVAAREPGERAIRWSSDGRQLYLRRQSSRTSIDILTLDVATGARTLWKTLAPADPVGIDQVSRVDITPDGSAYCYGSRRRKGALYLVEGLP